jgi:CRISPR system Cascade subunit CasE
MYLSRLILNPRNAQVRHELTYPYEMHRTLLNAFQNGVFKVIRSDDMAAGVLFRAEEHQHNNVVILLVQSKIEPDWSFLDTKKDSRGYAYLAPGCEDGKPNPAVSEFDLSEKIGQGQILSFRLRANPTKRRADSGKRIGIYKEDEQIDWLKRKADENGFRLLNVQISQNENIKDTIHRGDLLHNLKFLSVQFDGVLQVRDPERLVSTVQAGIGSGKGLGFGLLSLARATI